MTTNEDVQDWRNSLLAAWHDDPDERTFKRYMDGLETAVRRATVERIRERFASELGATINVHDAEPQAILDEEAAR